MLAPMPGSLVRRARAARFALSLALVAAGHLTVATVAPQVALAQGKISTQKLIDQAKEKFDDQQYDESIQKLSAALLRSDVTKAQKIEIYRWLAYNYIVLKQDDSARTALFALYALDEDYALPKTESPKFREPFEKYKKQWIDEGKPGQAKTEKPLPAVVLKQIPPAEAPHDQSIAVTGSIEDTGKRVAKITLFYRTGSSGKFLELPCTIDGGSYKATIPATAVKPPIVEYYVQASDNGGLAIATRGDAETPLRVAVQAEKEGSIFGTWWFWTGAAAIVAGGVVATYFLTRKSSTGPANPNAGIVITISE
jgi:hypothetical protein